MKNQLRYVLVALVLSFQLLAIQSKVALISIHSLKQELDNQTKNSLYVINVLPKSVCADCTIPTTHCIPFHQLAKKVKNLAKDRNIVVYCAGNNCPLAGYAYHELLGLGFNKVRLFAGGMREWKKHGYLTVGACKAGYLKG